MARSRSLGHQSGFAELHTTQAVTSLSCARSNLNPCISLLSILPHHEGIVNSSRAVFGTCHPSDSLLVFRVFATRLGLGRDLALSICSYLRARPSEGCILKSWNLRTEANRRLGYRRPFA